MRSEWTHSVRAAHTYNTSIITVTFMAANVRDFMQLCAVLYFRVRACARTARVYAKECGSVCGADWECACAFPPAGTIITARAHSRQLSPGGP